MGVYGGIEAGGTKFVCIIGNGPDDVRAEARFATTVPGETLENSIRFFKDYEKSSGEKVEAIGIACFGPVDLNPHSPHFGSITATPKPGWSNTPVTKEFEKAFGIPVIFDTDVNGAAVGERLWGAGRGLDQFIYFTIGTGIGGGAIVNGKPLHGLVHPEMGHICLPHNWEKDPFEGACPFHRDCFEGMASGPAIKARWGQPAESLPDDHPAWDLEAVYIALALQSLICTLSPQRVILGGGVMQQPQMFPLIRQKTQAFLNGYVRSRDILDNIDAYIVPPGLGSKAGVLGALAMAIQPN